MLASIAGAMVTSYLSRLMGKRNLFVAAFIFSGSINALFWFCGPDDIVQIFAIGLVSEFGAAIFPTLFLQCWVMLPTTLSLSTIAELQV